MTGTGEQIPAQLPALLYRAASQYPKQGIGFIQPDHSIRFCTYPELLNRTLRLLGGFQGMGLVKGDLAILSLDTSEEIIPTLWACFLGGIIPAILQPPVSFSAYNPAAEKAGKVYRLLGGPRVILSHPHHESWLISGIPAESLIDLAAVNSERTGTPAQDQDPDDLALLQFS